MIANSSKNHSANYHLSETLRTIGILNNWKFTFHLTGSRYFGNEKHNSDWDFFVSTESDEEQIELISLLSQAHFLLLKDPKMDHYDDPTIIQVHQRGLVQVQVVRDAELKACAQQILVCHPVRQLFVDCKHDPSAIRYWWSFAIHWASKIIYPLEG